LFSKIFEFRNNRKIPIDTIAAGIDAETVMPAYNPKYAIAAERTIERIILKNMALTVISFFIISTYKFLIFINNMKNKLISLITLFGLMMINFQVYHQHEFNSTDKYICNQECVDILSNKDSHNCDFCKFGFTKYVSNIDKSVTHDSSSNYSFLKNLNFVSYKSVHTIPNKSPPLV